LHLPQICSGFATATLPFPLQALHRAVSTLFFDSLATSFILMILDLLLLSVDFFLAAMGTA
jgi:hypothetical protein